MTNDVDWTRQTRIAGTLWLSHPAVRAIVDSLREENVAIIERLFGEIWLAGAQGERDNHTATTMGNVLSL